jgi:hypothetical protein
MAKLLVKGLSQSPVITVCFRTIFRTNRLLSLICYGPHRKWHVQQFFYCCSIVLIELLPSNDTGFLPNHCPTTIGAYTYRHTDWWEGFLKYAIEMGAGAMIETQSFLKIGSAIRKLIHRHTECMEINRTCLFLFFQNKESRLKMWWCRLWRNDSSVIYIN